MTAEDRRAIALPDGRTLAIRPVTPADVDRLGQLYDGLSVDDLHNRFFSVYRPDRAFLERVATIADHGGFGLVATVTGDEAGEDERIVAEAGYSLLVNGDGELAIVVAEGWRGWLGPVLLDALLAAAATRGVPNIEADVLVTNTPMQRLARSRGVATMAGDDWVSVRLMMGTAGRTPVWPDAHTLPRVLVETPGGRWHAGHAASEAGLRVLACSGPRGGRSRCPVLAGEPCPLAAEADAIVVSRPPDDERWAEIAAAHAALHPGVPVCIEPLPSSDATTPLPDGATPIPPDAGEAAAVTLVGRLARARRLSGR